VADATKFQRAAPVRIGHLSQINSFVTDRCESSAIRRICAEAQVDLVEAMGARAVSEGV
jgi:DeoR family glycerol-3-phosphate regulon repressor